MSHLDRGQSLFDIYAKAARPVVLTSVALGLGFALLMGSGFATVAALGAATSLTLLVALIFDLLVLPSMLTVYGFETGLGAAESEEPVPTVA
jgi:uncharacterized protein